MKKMFFMMCMVCVILLATNVFAGDVINVGWDVYSLIDDYGEPIIGLDIDIEFGLYWLAIHGGIVFEEGVAGCSGSGYIEGDTSYFFLNMQSYFFVVGIDLISGNGTIDLYNNNQELIDRGTMTLNWVH